MLALSIVGALLASSLVLFALVNFDLYVFKRYKHRFFTKGAFALIALVAFLSIAGHYWWQQAKASDGDPLNGLVLMTLGVCGTVGLLGWNIRRTDALVGLVGTLLQTGIVAVVAPFGVIGFLLCFIVTFVLFATARPVFVVNR